MDRHGRDNKLHVWTLPEDNAEKLREAAVQPDLPDPELLHSLDVNALNYCRFSLMSLDPSQSIEEEAFVAVPNLVESSLVRFHSELFFLINRSSGHIGRRMGTPDVNATARSHRKAQLPRNAHESSGRTGAERSWDHHVFASLRPRAILAVEAVVRV